jgi:hypothetical protein
MRRKSPTTQTVFAADGQPIELRETKRSFLGTIDPGLTTFTPDFVSFRHNGGRRLILELLGEEGRRAMELDPNEPTGYADTSHEVMDTIMAVELGRALQAA